MKCWAQLAENLVLVLLLMISPCYTIWGVFNNKARCCWIYQCVNWLQSVVMCSWNDTLTLWCISLIQFASIWPGGGKRARATDSLRCTAVVIGNSICRDCIECHPIKWMSGTWLGTDVHHMKVGPFAVILMSSLHGRVLWGVPCKRRCWGQETGLLPALVVHGCVGFVNRCGMVVLLMWL